jgi:hypothetical protein
VTLSATTTPSTKITIKDNASPSGNKTFFIILIPP